VKRDGLVLLGAVVGFTALIVIIGLALSIAPNLLAPPPTTPTPGGMVVENPKPARDFTLTDQNGNAMKFSVLRGKAVMVFFGYTHCPDVCPLEMADFMRIKKALQQSSPALVDQVAFVMVSVDGERDTPAVMKRYVETFDPEFIGLTGPADQVANIGLDYGVKVEKQKPSGTEASYLIAHTSFTYLFDPQGQWRVAYPFQSPTDQIARDIESMLRR
jgi:protein SCO1